MDARLMIAMTAIAASAALSMAALAEPAGSPPGDSDVTADAAPPVPQTTVGGKTLVKTWITYGNGNNAALTQFGYKTLESTVVKCSNDAGCTIGIESMAQLKPQGGDWAICLRVDGVTVGCQYQGHLAASSGWVVGNARGVKTGVASGSHTIDTQLYSEGAGATYAYYQTDVRVYKP